MKESKRIMFEEDHTVNSGIRVFKGFKKTVNEVEAQFQADS